MKLKSTGTIVIEGHNVFFCETGQWAVSFKGSHVGYADTLDEVAPLIARTREAVRKRVADVEAEAKQRAEAPDMMPKYLSMPRCRGQSILR